MAEEPPRTESLDANDYLSAERILALCANRFDGNAYQKDFPDFRPDPILNHCLASGEWIGTDNELQAQLFFLHRALGKWVLVYEPYNGKYWRACWDAFFKVASMPVPVAYRFDLVWPKWKAEYEPRLAECIEIVRQHVQTISFDDNAMPDLNNIGITVINQPDDLV